MRSKSDRILMVLRSLKLKTYLWSVCVMMGTALISCLFFLEPNTISAREAKIVNAFEEISSSDLLIEMDVNILNEDDASDQTDADVEAQACDVIESSDAVSICEKTDDAEPDASMIPVTIKEYEALCRIVQAEAGSEDHDGRVMISNVINNRIGKEEFPDDIVSVIEADGQFEPVGNGSYFRAVPDRETKVAVIDSLMGANYARGATYFQKEDRKYWGDKEYIFRYGSHSFYK